MNWSDGDERVDGKHESLGEIQLYSPDRPDRDSRIGDTRSKRDAGRRLGWHAICNNVVLAIGILPEYSSLICQTHPKTRRRAWISPAPSAWRVGKNCDLGLLSVLRKADRHLPSGLAGIRQAAMGCLILACSTLHQSDTILSSRMASRNLDIGSATNRRDTSPIRHSQSHFEADLGTVRDTHHGRISSLSDHRLSETGSDNRKRTSTTTDIHEDGTHTKEARTGTQARNRTTQRDRTTQRAAQACLRCRRQKLRCLGGNPCERCVRTSNACDFGHTGGRAVQVTAGENSSEVVSVPVDEEDPAVAHDQGRDERLKLLETNVANLLAGLAEEPDLNGQGYPHLEIFHEVVKHRKKPTCSAPSMPSSSSTRLPPPTHVRPLDPIRIGSAPLNRVMSPSSTYRGHQSISPGMLFDSSPNGSSTKAPRSLDAVLNQTSANRTHDNEALPFPVRQSLYEPPFRSLVRHVSLFTFDQADLLVRAQHT